MLENQTKIYCCEYIYVCKIQRYQSVDCEEPTIYQFSGVNVAPDPVPAGDVCLGGSGYDVLVGNHVVCRGLE